MTTTIGDPNTAHDVAAYHHNNPDAQYSRLAAEDEMTYVNSGQHRTVYVDYHTGTVYKVGLDSANREEHRLLTQARGEGVNWAPATTLYEITVDGAYGPIECTVIAMPYLPEDGSVDHDGVVIPYAGDFNPANVHAHGGQLWLIDAGGC